MSTLHFKQTITQLNKLDNQSQALNILTQRDEIDKISELKRLIKFNYLTKILSETFRYYEFIGNGKSNYLTIKGIFKGQRKEKYFVIKSDEILQDGKKSVYVFERGEQYDNTILSSSDSKYTFKHLI